jgi:hypothetical protein
MTPIPPQAVMFLIQSAWPVDLILPLTLDSLNGLRSRVAAGARQREGDTDFYRAIELLREVQKSGAVGMQIVRGGNQKETTVMLFYRDRLAPDLEAKLGEPAARKVSPW